MSSKPFRSRAPSNRSTSVASRPSTRRRLLDDRRDVELGDLSGDRQVVVQIEVLDGHFASRGDPAIGAFIQLRSRASLIQVGRTR